MIMQATYVNTGKSLDQPWAGALVIDGDSIEGFGRYAHQVSRWASNPQMKNKLLAKADNKVYIKSMLGDSYYEQNKWIVNLEPKASDLKSVRSAKYQS